MIKYFFKRVKLGIRSHVLFYLVPLILSIVYAVVVLTSSGPFKITSQIVFKTKDITTLNRQVWSEIEKHIYLDNQRIYSGLEKLSVNEINELILEYKKNNEQSYKLLEASYMARKTNTDNLDVFDNKNIKRILAKSILGIFFEMRNDFINRSFVFEFHGENVDLGKKIVSVFAKDINNHLKIAINRQISSNTNRHTRLTRAITKIENTKKIKQKVRRNTMNHRKRNAEVIKQKILNLQVGLNSLQGVTEPEVKEISDNKKFNSEIFYLILIAMILFFMTTILIVIVEFNNKTLTTEKEVGIYLNLPVICQLSKY